MCFVNTKHIKDTYTRYSYIYEKFYVCSTFNNCSIPTPEGHSSKEVMTRLRDF